MKKLILILIIAFCTVAATCRQYTVPVYFNIPEGYEGIIKAGEAKMVRVEETATTPETKIGETVIPGFNSSKVISIEGQGWQQVVIISLGGIDAPRRFDNRLSADPSLLKR